MTLQNIVSALNGRRVLVLGDIMLDEYIWGEVDRVSPEAPVPVVAVARRSFRPGGAANAAANIVALEATADLGGVVGDDDAALRLRLALKEAGIGLEGLAVDETRPTTVKTRVIAHQQQIVRVDSETAEGLRHDTEDRLLEWVESELEHADAFILSDYAKGVLTPRLCSRAIAAARRNGCPTVVDPKGSDFSKYRGATIITPNKKEAELALQVSIRNEKDVHVAGSTLMDLVEASVLITRGADGLSLFEPSERMVKIGAVARRVFDVTGAGDTVVSTLALALGAGASTESSARLANVAAGLVVGKLGTATISRAELTAEIERRPHSMEA